MEGIFDYIRIPVEEKVSCATYMFQMDARHWWDSMKSIIDVDRLTYERFKKKFYRKYLSEGHRLAKAAEFTNLRQGCMSVCDYIKKFNQLSRFAPHMVGTNELKVNQFL